jgi:transcriptional regulator with XRE-family HTH domain
VPFIPDRLRRLREAKGWKQLELEERSGVDHSQITRYERGKGKPSADTVERLAVALDATTDYLYGRGPEYDSGRAAACHMSFDVFNRDGKDDVRTRERCRRVLDDAPDVAPTTSEQWHVLATSIEAVFRGEPQSTERLDLRVVRGSSREAHADSPDDESTS